MSRIMKYGEIPYLKTKQEVTGDGIGLGMTNKKELHAEGWDL